MRRDLSPPATVKTLAGGADGKRTGSEMSSGEDEGAGGGAVLWRQCAITDRYQGRQMALVSFYMLF